LRKAFQANRIAGSFHLDPPGRIGSWKIAEFSLMDNGSGRFHYCPLDEDAGIDIFPQRDEQLAGERDDPASS
jgi:hypothetical protein